MCLTPQNRSSSVMNTLDNPNLPLFMFLSLGKLRDTLPAFVNVKYAEISFNEGSPDHRCEKFDIYANRTTLCIAGFCVDKQARNIKTVRVDFRTKLAGYDGSLVPWDLAGNRPAVTIEVFAGTFAQLSFSPEGKELIARES